MKKILVCVELTNDSINALKSSLKNHVWAGSEHITFIHGFQSRIYADNFYFTSFPHENEVGPVVDSVEKTLTTIASDIVPKEYVGKVEYKCILSPTPKIAIKDFAKEDGFDQVIVATQDKHGIEGIFHSSFAEYMVGHAHCDVLVVREKK